MNNFLLSRNDGKDDTANREIGLPTMATRTDLSALADPLRSETNFNRRRRSRLLDV